MISSARMTVHGVDLEVLRGGAGDPIVLLHGFGTFTAAARFPTLLAARGALLAPSLPGFGTSARPDDFETVYDLVHLLRALLDASPGDNVTLVGLSFGGWLAAELAALGHPRLGRLVLVDSVGIKLSDRQTADIVDVFNASRDTVRRAAWHDPDRYAPDLDAMEDAEIVRCARDWEALCRYAWHPYMHNPRLKYWLNRIAVPTLLVWGENDAIVTPDYGRGFARLIPGARFASIAACGHHPEIERPDELAALIGDFIKD